jgi:AraC family transcriptional regulator
MMPLPDVHPCGCPCVPNAEAAAGAFRLRYGVYLPQCRAGLHRHDEARIVLPTTGGFETRQGRHWLSPRAGEAVYRPAGDEHVDRYAATIHCLGLLLPGDGTLPAPRVAFVARGGALMDVAKALVDEMSARDTAAPLVREGLALLASTIVLQQRVLVERGAPRWLDIILDRLREADAEAPTLASLAASVDRDPAHVAATFKRVYGHSVGTAMRRLRLARARTTLLQDPGCELSALAQRCGFSDQSHFTRQFRQLFGVTPGGYRRRQRSAHAVAGAGVPAQFA